jgi:hypothetical protein
MGVNVIERHFADSQQMFQTYLDKSTPYTPYRWGGTATLFIFFGLRIFFAQGWYIGTLHQHRNCACKNHVN